MLFDFVSQNPKLAVAIFISIIIVIIVILGLSMGVVSLKKEGVTSGYVPGGMDQGYFSGERFGNMGTREGVEGPVYTADTLNQKYAASSQGGANLQNIMKMGGYTDLQGAINAEKVAKFRQDLGCASNVAFTGDEQEWRQAQSADEVNRRMNEGMKGSLDDKLSRQMQGL